MANQILDHVKGVWRESMCKIIAQNCETVKIFGNNMCYLPAYIPEFQFHIQHYACQAIVLNGQYCNHASNTDSRVGGDHVDHSWYNVRRRGIAET